MTSRRPKPFEVGCGRTRSECPQLRWRIALIIKSRRRVGLSEEACLDPHGRNYFLLPEACLCFCCSHPLSAAYQHPWLPGDCKLFEVVDYIFSKFNLLSPPACSAECSAACRPGLSKSCVSYWVEEGENTKYCSGPNMCQDCSFKTRLYFYTFPLKSSLLPFTNELSEAQGTQLICLRSCIKSVMISGSVSPEDTHSPLEPRAGTEKEQSLARAAVLRWVSRAGASGEGEGWILISAETEMSFQL